jgi:hypothetical protein
MTLGWPQNNVFDDDADARVHRRFETLGLAVQRITKAQPAGAGEGRTQSTASDSGEESNELPDAL